MEHALIPQDNAPRNSCRGLRLVADIGGTNARFALALDGAVLWNTVARYATSHYSTALEAIQHYLSTQRENPDSACIAVAGPTIEDGVRMTNGAWTVKRTELKQALHWQAVEVINDFAALAYSLPHLLPTQVVQVGGDKPQGLCTLVIGPGTGFGGAALISSSHGNIVVPGESGHAAIGASTERELALFSWLFAQPGQSGGVYREQLLSGPGLALIDQGLAALDNRTAPMRHAEAIVTAALGGESYAMATLDMFCALLGSAARDLALSLGARGGVYIAGGIVRRFLPLFQKSGFRQRFESSPHMAEYLQAIPVYVISESGMGLVGAAIAPLLRLTIIDSPLREV